jgi:hypothetical protein
VVLVYQGNHNLMVLSFYTIAFGIYPNITRLLERSGTNARKKIVSSFHEAAAGLFSIHVWPGVSAKEFAAMQVFMEIGERRRTLRLR